MDVDLTRADVVGTYAGLRPLIAPSGGSSTVKASREHRVTVEPNGVVRIGGGKYTTYRVMARDVVDAALGTGGAPTAERHRRLAAGRGGGARPELDRMAAELATIPWVGAAHPEAAARLVARHGTDAAGVVALGSELGLTAASRPGARSSRQRSPGPSDTSWRWASTTSCRAGRGWRWRPPTEAPRSRRGWRPSSVPSWAGMRRARRGRSRRISPRRDAITPSHQPPSRWPVRCPSRRPEPPAPRRAQSELEIGPIRAQARRPKWRDPWVRKFRLYNAHACAYRLAGKRHGSVRGQRTSSSTQLGLLSRLTRENPMGSRRLPRGVSFSCTATRI